MNRAGLIAKKYKNCFFFLADVLQSRTSTMKNREVKKKIFFLNTDKKRKKSCYLTHREACSYSKRPVSQVAVAIRVCDLLEMAAEKILIFNLLLVPERTANYNYTYTHFQLPTSALRTRRRALTRWHALSQPHAIDCERGKKSRIKKPKKGGIKQRSRRCTRWWAGMCEDLRLAIKLVLHWHPYKRSGHEGCFK